MKTLHLYGLFFAFLLASCGGSDDEGTDPGPNPPGEEEIIGNRNLNLANFGASANDFLSNENYDRLLIQVGYVSGFRPSDAVFEDFEAFIAQHTFKTDIEFIYKSLPSPGEEDLTFQEIADLEEENRTRYNDGTTLALYIYFADAPAEADEPDSGLVTLGAVYRNTSMVIFESTLRNFTAPGITLADLERATLFHEFGHLLGLVDSGTGFADGIDHEDPASSSHCNRTGCLMRAELTFASKLVKTMQQRAARGMATVPPFDSRCLADLEANGGRPVVVARESAAIHR